MSDVDAKVLVELYRHARTLTHRFGHRYEVELSEDGFVALRRWLSPTGDDVRTIHEFVPPLALAGYLRGVVEATDPGCTEFKT